MKVILKYTLYTLFAAWIFSSCEISLKELQPAVPETRGLMEVDVTENLGSSADRMKTVRFFVFENISSGTPVLELNQRFDIPAPAEGEASKFKIVLELKMKVGQTNEKMVVAVVNEPTEMTTGLEAVSDYSGLENATLDFSHFLNDEQTGLKDEKAMPMTGVIWTDKVFPTVAEAEADPVHMSVLRAVGRVDVYVRQESGLGLTLEAGTRFSLRNSYDREYLVRHTGSRSFGKIQTVTSGFHTGSVTFSDSDGLQLPEIQAGEKGRLVASFYTAERTCTAASNADKLEVGIDIVTHEGAPRTGTVVVDRFNKEGVKTDVFEITRNNIYEIIATVGTNGITAFVQDWNDQNIEPEL